MAADEAESLDLRALKEKAQAKAKEETRIVAREERFGLRYHAPDGVLRETTLVSRILTGDERHAVSRMCALLANGVPFDHLPAGDQVRFYALSVCTIQLREPPEWVLNWIAQDVSLLYAVFKEVEGHDTRYFRRDVQSSEDGPNFSPVEITPIEPSTVVA